jgi:hypothetical protein
LILVAGNSRLNKNIENQGIEMRSTQKSEVIRSRHRHITLMLLAVAVVFLLLTLPNSIYFVLDLTYGFNKHPTVNDYYQWLRYRRLTILTVIMFQLSDLQHATNFFLYLLTSDKFRRSIVMICTSSVHFLSSLLNCCCCQNKTDSSISFQNHYSTQRHDKNTMSFRSSASDMSTNTCNVRYTSTRQKPQPSYKYRSLVSKPTIITVTETA